MTFNFPHKAADFHLLMSRVLNQYSVFHMFFGVLVYVGESESVLEDLNLSTYELIEFSVEQ